nr:hypothetical protein [Halobacterium salinarum]
MEKLPDRLALSRTWRNRFDDEAQEVIETAAHFLVKEIYTKIT